MQNRAHVLSGSAHTKLIVRSMLESTTGANQAVHGNQELIAQERIIKHAGLAEGAEVVHRDFNWLPLWREPSAKMAPQALPKGGCNPGTVQTSTWDAPTAEVAHQRDQS